MHQIKKPKKQEALCHWRVKKIAEEMAGMFYELAAHSDVFYKHFPNQEHYIRGHWGEFVGDARGALADMLTKDYPEDWKDDILDALLLDRTLPASQTRAIN